MNNLINHHFLKYHLFLMAALYFLCVGFGCSGGDACKLNRDCEIGERCRSGVCLSIRQDDESSGDGGEQVDRVAQTEPSVDNKQPLPDRRNNPEPVIDHGNVDRGTPDKNVPKPDQARDNKPPDTRPPVKPGSGFAATARSWSVPSLSGIRSGAFTTNRAYGYEFWNVLDMNGDGKPDLVWTSQATTRTPWGDASSPHWKVFLNNGSGFSSSPTNWSVPVLSGIRSGAFTTNRAYGYEFWNVLDMNGDGKPDLVWTSRTTARAPWGDASGPHWKVYLNTGSGFSKSPITWSVPVFSGIKSGVFTTNRAYGYEFWNLLDINGDGKPDLVWTSRTTTRTPWGDASGPYWKVYLNTGSGFAKSPQNWVLPVLSGIKSGAFTTNRAYGYEFWNLLDMNGDRKPDLVWTSRTTTRAPWGDASSPYWKVYLNNGRGFSTNPSSWVLPVLSGIKSGAFTTNRAYGYEFWNTFDLNGDGKPDLIWTSQTSKRIPWGTPSKPVWKVFLNSGGGFIPSSKDWPVPVLSGIQSGAFTTNRAYGYEFWNTFDLNGDKKPDFIWTSQTSSRIPWSGPVWKVFLNQ